MADPVSPTDTIPLPDGATWEYFPGAPEGDFARLIPRSAIARQSFNCLVRRIIDDASYLPHSRRFIHFEDAMSREEEDSSDASFFQPPDINAVCGYYRLDMSLPPNNLHLGWIIGSGRPDLPEDEVDFVLTAETNQHNVRGRHCRLQRDLQTGVLLIISDGRSLILDGKDVLRRNLQKTVGIERIQPEHEYQRALYTQTGIMIGDLSYLLEFTLLREEVQQKQLQEARAAMGIEAPPSMLLSPTPLKNTYEYFGYVVYPVTHGGVSSTVAFAYSKATGKPVVIKKMKRGPTNYKTIQMEINLLRTLSHENIYKLVEVIDKSGRTSIDPFGQNEYDEIALVLAPPAATMLAASISTWETEIGEQAPEVFLAAIVKQCCSGLEYMHRKGIMHRDIKPDNLGIVSLEPPVITIIDLGHSELGLTSSDHMRGTIRYLAPEVMRIKEGKSVAPFNEKVDIWALGITLIELLWRRRMTFTIAREERRQWLARELSISNKKNPELSFFFLLAGRLLEWEHSRRASASAALRYLEDRFPGVRAEEVDDRELPLQPLSKRRG